MEPNLKVLDLFLSALGEELTIDSIDDRMRLQKAVYLGQLFGVDLGYSYSWYVKGPYSPALTQDYYSLVGQLNRKNVEGELRPDLLEKLKIARIFLMKPENIELSTAHWYELLASLHYLYKRSHQDSSKVKNTITTTKPHLAQWVEHGEAHLQKFKLI